FAGAGVAGNQPSATKILPRPRQSFQVNDRAMIRANSRHNRVRGKSPKHHGQRPRERWSLAQEKVPTGGKGQAGSCESEKPWLAHGTHLPIRMPASSASAALN